MLISFKKIVLFATVLATFSIAENENAPAALASTLKSQWAILKKKDVDSSLKTIVAYELTRKDLVALDPIQTEFPPMDVESLVVKALSSSVPREVAHGMEFVLDSDELRKIDYVPSEEVWKKFFLLMRTLKPLTLNKVKDKLVEWPQLPEKSVTPFYEWVQWESASISPTDKRSFSLERLYTLGEPTHSQYLDSVQKLNELNDSTLTSPQLHSLLTKLASRISDPSRPLVSTIATYAALGNHEAFNLISQWYEQPAMQDLIFLELRLSLLDPMVPNDYKDDLLNLLQLSPEYGMLLFAMAQSEDAELSDFALRRLKVSPASIATENMIKVATKILYDTKQTESAKRSSVEVLRLNPLTTNNEVWIALLNDPDKEVISLSLSILKNLPASLITDQQITMLLRLMNEEEDSAPLAKEILNEWAERNLPILFQSLRRLGVDEGRIGDLYARELQVRYLPEYFPGKINAPVLLARNLRQTPLDRTEESFNILKKTKPTRALVSPIIELLADENYRPLATDLLTEWNTQDKSGTKASALISELLWSRIVPLYASLKKHEADQRAIVDAVSQIKPKEKTGSKWMDLLDHTTSNEARTLVLGKIRRLKTTDELKRRLKEQLFATDAEHVENTTLLLRHWSVEKSKALSSQAIIRKAQGLLLQESVIQQDAAVKLLELVGYNPVAKPPIAEYYRALLDATLSKNDPSAQSAIRLLSLSLTNEENLKHLRGRLSYWILKSFQKEFSIARMGLTLTKLSQERSEKLKELLSDELAEVISANTALFKSEELFRSAYHWGSKILAPENKTLAWLHIRSLDYSDLRSTARQQLKINFERGTLRILSEDAQKRLAQQIGTTAAGKETNALFSKILRSQLRLSNLAAKFLFEKVALQDLEVNARTEALLLLQESRISDDMLVKNSLFDILDSSTQPIEIKALASVFLMSRYLTPKEAERFQSVLESSSQLQNLVTRPNKIFEQHEPQGIYTLKELNQPAWYSAGALKQSPQIGNFILRSRQVAEEWVKGFIRQLPSLF